MKISFYIKKNKKQSVMPESYLISKSEIKKNDDKTLYVKMCAQTLEKVLGLQLEPGETIKVTIDLIGPKKEFSGGIGIKKI